MKIARVAAEAFLVIFFFLTVFPGMRSAHATTSEPSFDLIQQCEEDKYYLTGGWKGTRDDLAGKGVTFASTYVCDVLGNTNGGMEQGARYDHSMGWDINFDLEKFVKIADTQFHISGLWRAGQNLSTATIGNALVVSTIYGSEQFRFYGLYLERSFFNDKLNLRIGRISAGDDFATSPLYGIFVSNAIDGNPINIPINFFFSCYPTAVWGARARTVLSDDLYVLSGIYDGDPRVGRQSACGCDFSMRLKRGIAFAEELAYVPNTAKCGKGMPGHYKAGIYYNSALTRDLYSDINGNSYSVSGLPQKKHIGDYNIYFHADQMIYREDAPRLSKKHSCDVCEEQGLIPIIAAAIGPDNVNKFPFLIMSGLVYKGLVPKRDDDITAFEIVYTKWSDHIRHSEQDVGAAVQQYEIMYEFTHRIMMTKWMYMQPDLQYIIQPGGTGNTKDALVIGFQFGLTF